MKSNKGLSDVITTVLIIVLALAAVAIIGAVVLNQVTKTGDLVDAAQVCNQLDMKVTSCTKDTVVDPDTITVNSVRQGGDNSVDVTGLMYYFADANNNERSHASSPKIGLTMGIFDSDSTNVTFPLGGLTATNALKVRVQPMITVKGVQTGCKATVIDYKDCT